MQVEVCTDPAIAASRAAGLIAASAQGAIADRGFAAIALSGGSTPARMLAALATAPVDWRKVHIFQVDERLVLGDDDRRNVNAIRLAFANAGVAPDRLYPMPVDIGSIRDAMDGYAQLLCKVAGTPPVLDAIHLGLGEDGHTASLFPGDAAVDASGLIALSGMHGSVRRMTVTLEVINRARVRIWLVTGASKRAIVRRLLTPGSDLPASRVRTDDSVVVLDRDAAADSR